MANEKIKQITVPIDETGNEKTFDIAVEWDNIENKPSDIGGSDITIDDTLTQSGQAADAKAVGDKLVGVKSGEGEIFNSYSGDQASTITNSKYAHAEGERNDIENSRGTHAEGGANTASTGNYIHVEGMSNEAYSDYAHAEGSYNKVYGIASHVEGGGNKSEDGNLVIGEGTHVEGTGNSVYSDYSHIEGGKNQIGKNGDRKASVHVEGSKNIIIYGDNTGIHVEGEQNNIVSGRGAHVEGGGNKILQGYYTHLEGYYNIANRNYQHIGGRYNLPDPPQINNEFENAHAIIIGNGSSISKNANIESPNLIRPQHWIFQKRNPSDIVYSNNEFTFDVRADTKEYLIRQFREGVDEYSNFYLSLQYKYNKGNSNRVVYFSLSFLDQNKTILKTNRLETTKSINNGEWQEISVEIKSAPKNAAFIQVQIGSAANSQSSWDISYSVKDIQLTEINSKAKTYRQESNAYTLDWEGNAWFAGGVKHAGAIRLTSADNLNYIMENGIYAWRDTDKPQGAPDLPGSGYLDTMRVTGTGSACVQEVFDISDSLNTSGTRVQRVIYGSTYVGEWEWVNPPMTGLEYRTTERYNGKPVYAKVVNCGYLPNNNEKLAYFCANSRTATVIRLNGFVKRKNTDSEDIFPMPMYDTPTGVLVANVFAKCHRTGLDYSYLVFRTYADMSAYMGYAVVYYTLDLDN